MSFPRRNFIYVALLVCIFLLFGVISFVKADVSGAYIFFDTANTKVNQGDQVTINIRVNTAGQSINTVTGDFKIPSNFTVQSIEDTDSILDFWVVEPKVVNGAISFQGVAIKSPYDGENGLVFTMRGIVSAPGTLQFTFDDGAILANDGLGTNIISSLKNLSLAVGNLSPLAQNTSKPNTTSIALANKGPIIPPVITSDVSLIEQSQSFSLLGKGTPNSLTKIQFQDISQPSLGQKIIQLAQGNKVKLSSVEVRNDKDGVFAYFSPSNLEAGVYTAVPSYVTPDKSESIPGTGVQLSVVDNTLDQTLVIIIDALVLIVPIIVLILIIIFLPWYFRKRLHVMGKKIEFEEEKIDVEEKNLMRGKKG